MGVRALKRGTPEHPKTLDLMQRLACSRPVAVGVLELLWHFTARYSPAGDIGRWSNASIANGIGWDGDADELVDALCGSRWLDEDAKCRLVVHDWPEHADDGVHVFLCRALKAFADGSEPSDKRLSRKERAILNKRRSRRAPGERTESAQPSQGLAIAIAEPKPLDPVVEVFDHWRLVHGHPKGVLDEKRRRAVKDRLDDGYAVEQLKQAIDGCKASKFHQGANEERKVYDSLTLILRDAEHVDRFIAEYQAAHRQRAGSKRPPESQQRVDLVRELHARGNRNGQAVEVWSQALEKLAEIPHSLSVHALATWFRPTVALGLLAEPPRLVVQVPSEQSRDWLRKNFRQQIEAAIAASAADLQLRLVTEDEVAAAAHEPP